MHFGPDTVLFHEGHERVTVDAVGPGSASPWGQASAPRHPALFKEAGRKRLAQSRLRRVKCTQGCALAQIS